MGDRNVILITIDALRADHLSCLGYERRTTPYIDQLCEEEGVLFSQAISQSSHTPEAFPSLLFSKYPFRFHRGRISIAELLKRNGYITGAFHSNPFLSRAYGYNKGFDDFDDSLLLGRSKFTAFAHRVVNYFFRAKPYLSAEEITAKAAFWLHNLNHKRRFFLWLHYMDPHPPYQPPPGCQEQFLEAIVDRKSAKKIWRRSVDRPESITEFEKRTLIGLYDAEIRYMDEHIDTLVKTLRKLGLFDKTLIIITADHGEQFQEHGRFGHPRQLYDELLRVPLIFVDSSLPKGKNIQKLVRSIDVAPSICDILDIRPHASFEGKSLLSLIRGENEEPELEGISECSGKKEKFRKFSIRTGLYKYILTLKPDGSEASEFYCLRDDPGERRNLANEESMEVKEVMKELDIKLREHIADTDKSSDGASVQREMSEDEIRVVEERLKKLGYIDE